MGSSAPSGGQFPGQQNGFVQPKAQEHTKMSAAKLNKAGEQSYAQVAAPGPHGESGEGSSQPAGPPPTYADVIKGDHKVQTP